VEVAEGRAPRVVSASIFHRFFDEKAIDFGDRFVDVLRWIFEGFSITFRYVFCSRARAATDARHRENTACSGTKRTTELARQSATTIEKRSANDRENV